MVTFTNLDIKSDMAAALAANIGPVQNKIPPATPDDKETKLCVNALGKCINDTIAIYEREEKAFADEITRLHERGKAFCSSVEANLAKLEKGPFDQKVLDAIEAGVQEIMKVEVQTQTEGRGLVAHQGMRNKLFDDQAEATVKQYLGDKNLATLTNHFIAKRKPTIDLISSLSDKRAKIKEFTERGKSCLKRAESLDKSFKVNGADLDKTLDDLVKKVDIFRFDAEAFYNPKGQGVGGKVATFFDHVKKKTLTKTTLQPALLIVREVETQLKEKRAAAQTVELQYDNLVKTYKENKLDLSATPGGKEAAKFIKTAKESLDKFVPRVKEFVAKVNEVKTQVK